MVAEFGFMWFPDVIFAIFQTKIHFTKTISRHFSKYKNYMSSRLKATTYHVNWYLRSLPAARNGLCK